MITSLEWDPMSWMTSDYEVEIRARSMEDEGQREVFCRNFGGHWDKEYNKFFRIPEEHFKANDLSAVILETTIY